MILDYFGIYFSSVCDSNVFRLGLDGAMVHRVPRPAEARGPALVLGYRGRSNRQGFSPHGEVKEKLK